ncbi:MAG: hypothetical protein ACI9TF_001561 [Paracrocinitomix sp.]|jgi:hypothetical protein
MDECTRMTCDKPAVALLTFSPPDAKAWLYDLDQSDPTGGIMLCRKHANATVVPMSWQLLDARDPAWPGPVGSQPPVQAMMAASAEELMPSLDIPSNTALPSDTSAIDEEFAALQADLPVTPRRYAEPQLVTARAAGRSIESDLMVDLGNEKAPDPSLFELPLSDIPAVTPHPG